MTTLRVDRGPGRAIALAGLVAVGAVACAAADDAATVPTATSEGAAVYADACASCHGTDLRGTDRGPSHLSIVYEPNHHGDASFRNAIANGAAQHHWDFGDMPPIEGLTADEVELVIAFIRSEQHRQGFEG